MYIESNTTMGMSRNSTALVGLFRRLSSCSSHTSHRIYSNSNRVAMSALPRLTSSPSMLTSSSTNQQSASTTIFKSRALFHSTRPIHSITAARSGPSVNAAAVEAPAEDVKPSLTMEDLPTSDESEDLLRIRHSVRCFFLFDYCISTNKTKQRIWVDVYCILKNILMPN